MLHISTVNQSECLRSRSYVHKHENVTDWFSKPVKWGSLIVGADHLRAPRLPLQEP